MIMLTDRPEMTLDVYRGRKTTQHNLPEVKVGLSSAFQSYFRSFRHLQRNFSRTKTAHSMPCGPHVCVKILCGVSQKTELRNPSYILINEVLQWRCHVASQLRDSNRRRKRRGRGQPLNDSRGGQHTLSPPPPPPPQ